MALRLRTIYSIREDGSTDVISINIDDISLMESSEPFDYTPSIIDIASAGEGAPHGQIAWRITMGSGRVINMHVPFAWGTVFDQLQIDGLGNDRFFEDQPKRPWKA
jgi:hypothetical protein